MTSATPDAQRLAIITREQGEDHRYGIGQSVGRIARVLTERGHSVRYMTQTQCPQAHARWRPRLMPFLRPLGTAAPALAERLVQGAWAAREALRWGATHAWVQDPWLAAGVRLGLYHARYWRRPFTLWVSEHGLGSFTWAVTQDGLALSPCQRRLLLALERRALSTADAVICPSWAVHAALQRDLGMVCAPSHWRVLPYGRPIAPPLPTHTPRAAFAWAAALPAQVPIVMAAGRLAPVKRFAVLLKACQLLQNTYRLPVQLVIAGGGDSASLLQQAHALGLHYPPVIEAVDSLAPWLAVADAYASACSVEAFGLANREAVAAGLPCVMAAGGASDEVLDHGAWLVPGRADTMAQALYTVLTNEEASQFWRQQAALASAQWPRWEEAALGYERLLYEF